MFPSLTFSGETASDEYPLMDGFLMRRAGISNSYQVHGSHTNKISNSSGHQPGNKSTTRWTKTGTVVATLLFMPSDGGHKDMQGTDAAPMDWLKILISHTRHMHKDSKNTGYNSGHSETRQSGGNSQQG